MAQIIRRYRGDNYPIKATISRDGDFSLVGLTVQMSIKIGNLVTHILSGTITDSVNGKVEFIPTPTSVADVGVGVYDIEVSDGTYTTTYLKDEIEILQDVTV